MSEPTQLEEALALALQLTPGDRLRLVERVVGIKREDLQLICYEYIYA